MYNDKNGDPLEVNGQVIVLGKVTAISGEIATVSLTKYGTSVGLSFLLSEVMKASFADGHVSGVITGDEASIDDDVMILGIVNALAPGIHAIANVGVTQDGSIVELTFYCSEVIKAVVDGNTVVGVVSGPTVASP